MPWQREQFQGTNMKMKACGHKKKNREKWKNFEMLLKLKKKGQSILLLSPWSDFS